ncbi:MAG: hypothetical protein AAGB24_11120 [Bacteroidota bacterium]
MRPIVTEHTTTDELLIRVKRNHSNVQRFLKVLSSYTCEPTDYNCFERLADLKDSFHKLKGEQEQLIASITTAPVLTSDLKNLVQLQLQQFQELEAMVAAYMLDSKSYY